MNSFTSEEEDDIMKIEEMTSELGLEGSHPKVSTMGFEASSEQLRYSCTSIESLSGENNLIKLKNAPASRSTEALITPPNTGYLRNLTSEQREKLFQLWEMLFDYFSQPFERKPVKRQKELSLERLDGCLQDAYDRKETTVTEVESTAFESNPLTAEMFAQCSTDDPDRTALRYLRARKWVVTDAFNMLIDALKWRHSSGLRGLMCEGEKKIKLSLLEGGKNFFWKTDKDGRLVCYIRSRLHDKNAQTLEESIEFTIYTVEVGRRLRSEKDQLVTVIFDLRDAPLASLDVGMMQFMVQALQSFYPEILGKCLVMEAPWIFNGFWKMVRPLLDPAVAAKIEFIKQADLPTFIDKENIPIEYGGTDAFSYNYTFPRVDDYPRPASETESQLLLTRLEVLKTRFVECTREIHSFIARVESPSELESILLPHRERRDEIKEQLELCYRQLDTLVLPRTFYHRMGVLDNDWKVNWDNYREAPPAPECRMSAPPAIEQKLYFKE
jgi:hypothetical protein